MANTSFCKLLNRLLAVKVDMQRKVFDYFTAFQVCLDLEPSDPHGQSVQI